MWNKLFKSKSKSSKNLSTANGSTSTIGSPSTTTTTTPARYDPVEYLNDNSSRYYFEAYGGPVEFRNDAASRQDAGHRDSIGAQMCGIPMRKSKISSAFKSLSLRRGSSKNQLKLYRGTGADVPVGADEIEISASSKRASLRPSKSDNNLNEKQQYADQEKDNLEEDAYNNNNHQNNNNSNNEPVLDPFLQIPADPPPDLELRQCPICSRNFVPPSLAKHISICERMQTKKRKPFDSSRQRREGTELASYLPKNFGLPQNHPQARVSPPKTTNPVRKLSTSKTPTPERKDYGGGVNSNMMSRSQTLTTSDGVQHQHAAELKSPRPVLKRSLSQQNEPCPYCERCFGFKAYDRHVEWCREKALLSKNINNSQTISAAKERLNARIQYKAPQIRSKRALNREKYSGSLSCGGSTNSLADLDLPLPRHRSHLNSMSSSISSDNGYTPDRYDPFLSAKRQLEELFSPTSSYSTSTPRQQTSNYRATTPVTPTAAMSKSVVTPTSKTSPLINSNFRRASSLRMPRKVSRPMYIEKAKSNIQKGITDDGPVSPNFLKSSEYDEIPIKSAFNALQMAEKPKMRDSSATRKNLKLDIKDPNLPATDIPLSKTDSLAAFLKYEHELALAAMTEKDKKDKSNSLSKRSSSLSGHDRKEPVQCEGVAPIKEFKIERSQREEKEKCEKILQDMQSLKKQPQKLVPIKLEPINITYNSNIVSNNLNCSGSGSNHNDSNNKNNTNPSKPTVISLDTILGKSNKPKIIPVNDKENQKDSNYINPQLINKCDNLPMKAAAKISVPEIKPVIKPLETQKPPLIRATERSNSSPESTGGGKGSGGVAQPEVDNRLKDHNSTNSDTSDDRRPALTRQNGTSASASASSNSSSRDASREESPDDPQPQRSVVARNQSHNDDAKPQTPDLPSSPTAIPKVSTPIAVVQKKPERPPLPSFDDFDFDKFISSFEEERRSFKNAFYSHSPIPNGRNNSSGSFSSRTYYQPTYNVDNKDSPSSVKSVASSNGSNSCSSSNNPSHVTSPNSHTHHKSFDNHVRSEEVPKRHTTTTQQQQRPQQQSQESPRVPPRRNLGDPASSTIRNLPSLPVNNSFTSAESPLANPMSPSALRIEALTNYGFPNDTINNNTNINGSPLARNSPSATRFGNSGNSFNPHPPNAMHQPYQQPLQVNNNNNSSCSPVPTRLVPQPYASTPSPLFDHSARHQSPFGTNGLGSVGSATDGGKSGGGGGITFDDLSPTERDLMKSVQELDRMCESSSSMYPADSDEVSSVEGYPLSNSSRDHQTVGRHHHQRATAEASKFSADSAYGSLSRQSPPLDQQQQHHTIRRTYHQRGSGKSTTSAATAGGGTGSSQQDAFDNSSGSESSLPPITAPLKTQKIELIPHHRELQKMTNGQMGNGGGSNPMSKFCHECGSRFMINTAKFCMECGIRRIMLD
ncbi:uncharacterized protein LOC128738957 isoform X2 [Sabethes cyaneus]|uniref:uncharacterized protein LOC128738957 isoform X2 n=1 Tax=Sabethes cyaneus TaxID=53552 RepID=UPI00237D8519|nr:uncharacterized protein LOC128738957 isoform X2 [Sabethes cyaneus]